MKQCSRCKEMKELIEFPKDSSRADGHKYYCKKCYNNMSKKWPSGQFEERRKVVANYRERNRDKINNYFQEYRENNLEKCRAQDAVKVALRANQLNKADTCSKCGSSRNIQAHHEDYTKPLDIVWLCASCHKQLHMSKG